MTMYEAVKHENKWYIRSLSICFKPIYIFGLMFDKKRDAVNAACNMSGFNDKSKAERSEYLKYLQAYLARILKENNGIMPYKV